jgi:hypothetical protein
LPLHRMRGGAPIVEIPNQTDIRRLRSGAVEYDHFVGAIHISHLTPPTLKLDEKYVKNDPSPCSGRQTDVWIVAGIAEPWISGYVQFDDFSVTTAAER